MRARITPPLIEPFRRVTRTFHNLPRLARSERYSGTGRNPRDIRKPTFAAVIRNNIETDPAPARQYHGARLSRKRGISNCCTLRRCLALVGESEDRFEIHEIPPPKTALNELLGNHQRGGKLVRLPLEGLFADESGSRTMRGPLNEGLPVGVQIVVRQLVPDTEPISSAQASIRTRGIKQDELLFIPSKLDAPIELFAIL